MRKAKNQPKDNEDGDPLRGDPGVNPPRNGNHALVVKNWLRRIGNSRKPDSWQTVIILTGTDESNNAGDAYLTFYPNSATPRPPSYDPARRRIQANYSVDQLDQIMAVLELIGRKSVVMIYREYEDGHRWAELQHEAMP